MSFLERQQARRDTIIAENERRAQRNRGVAWSGMDLEPLPVPSERDMIAAAEASAARAEAWKESAEGQAISAAIALRKRCVDLHSLAERVNAALSRQDGSAIKASEQFQRECVDIRADAAELVLLVDILEKAR